jgi:uncharacterized membrane protein
LPKKFGYGKKKEREKTGEGRIGRKEEEKEELFEVSKKTTRSLEVEKKPGKEMEKILEKLEEIKVEIKEMGKENQEVERAIARLREEFKNKEKNWTEEKTA